MSEWISVKDRLPSEYGEYLVWRTGYADQCQIATYSCYYHGEIPEWSGEFLNDRDATHWMPLPPAPEKDK